MKIQEKISLYILGGLAAVSIAVILYGSSALESITVSYIGKGKEHSDKFIPGVNQHERAPDYGIKVNTKTGWKIIGVVNNKFINDGILTFKAPEGIPIRNIFEIQFYDEDPVESDILERLSFAKGESKGTNYKFLVTTGLSISAGLAFFWATAVGKAILLGITAGIAMIIIFHFDFFDIG